MDWDIEVKLSNAEHMITVYEKHIEDLEKENKSLKLQVEFLKQQLYNVQSFCNFFCNF